MINKVSSKKLEIETSIKLLEYLKRNSIIDDDMYNFCINKFTYQLEKTIIDNDKCKILT